MNDFEHQLSSTLREVMAQEPLDIDTFYDVIERILSSAESSPIDALDQLQSALHHVDLHHYVCPRPCPPTQMVQWLLAHYRFLMRQSERRPPSDDMLVLDTVSSVSVNVHRPEELMCVLQWFVDHSAPFFGGAGDYWGGIEAGDDVREHQLIEQMEDMIEADADGVDEDARIRFFELQPWKDGPTLPELYVNILSLKGEPFIRVRLHNSLPSDELSHERFEYWRVSSWPVTRVAAICEVVYQLSQHAPSSDVEWLTRHRRAHSDALYPSTYRDAALWPTEKPMMEALWRFFQWARRVPR